MLKKGDLHKRIVRTLEADLERSKRWRGMTREEREAFVDHLFFRAKAMQRKRKYFRDTDHTVILPEFDRFMRLLRARRRLIKKLGDKYRKSYLARVTKSQSTRKPTLYDKLDAKIMGLMRISTDYNYSEEQRRWAQEEARRLYRLQQIYSSVRKLPK